MLTEAIRLLRRYSSGLMSPAEAREFMIWAVNSGLVWATPGVWGIASALQYQRDGGIK